MSICNHCDKEFKSDPKYPWTKYCSISCRTRAATKRSYYKIMSPCLQCGKSCPRTYCSTSCSNIHKPRRPRKTKLFCLSCSKEMIGKDKRTKYCSYECRYPDISLREAIYKELHRSSAFARVRARARTVMKNVTSCERCGYDKHVEIAHIRSISDFPETAMLSKVNARSNLMALCPNCHWEFDHGL